MSALSPAATVLRLGHRPSRDKRLSTHLLLAARAFGAEAAYYTGIRDGILEDSVNAVTDDWGGSFTVSYADSWKRVIESWNGKVVHLTMYGLPIQEIVHNIKAKAEPILVVVGGAKVPSEMYRLADWNIAVTNQPHSEVSALALLLHELYESAELNTVFNRARLRITPSARGKNVEKLWRPV